jgi:hypothetical protein
VHCPTNRHRNRHHRALSAIIGFVDVMCQGCLLNLSVRGPITCHRQRRYPAKSVTYCKAHPYGASGSSPRGIGTGGHCRELSAEDSLLAGDCRQVTCLNLLGFGNVSQYDKRVIRTMEDYIWLGLWFTSDVNPANQNTPQDQASGGTMMMIIIMMDLG